MSFSEQMFMKGYDRLEKELSDYDILKTLKKFRAAFSHMIQDADDIR